MASRRQQTKRGRQKLILAVGVTVLIILIVLIVGLTTFLKKYSPSKEVTNYKEYYSLSEDDELFCRMMRCISIIRPCINI